MLGYYLRLAWLGMRRTPAITLLMVLAIALGIAVTTTSLTVLHLMSRNPIAHRNDVLYAVTMDSWDPTESYDRRPPALPPDLLTHRDAQAVLASDVPTRRVEQRRTALTVEPARADGKPFLAEARLTTGDFFAMFDVPFRWGAGWGARADRSAEPVVVLSQAANEKAFGGDNSVGRTVRLDGRDYRVVGVLEDWQPTPKFYDPSNGTFEGAEDLYLPFAQGERHQLQTAGNVNCWKPEPVLNFGDLLNSECVWTQAWVELPTADHVRRFQQYVDGYVAQQKRLGRFPRPMHDVLYRPDAWLARAEAVRDDNRVLVGLSLMFLAVCILNVVGLLLSKFLGGAPTAALRRALGASRGDVFRQHLVEVAAIGGVGGVLGLGLGWLGLRGMAQLYENFDRLTRLDWPMVGAALAISLAAGVLAGLYPAWRVCRVQPAAYLKTQ